jgi:hypothetical protein
VKKGVIEPRSCSLCRDLIVGSANLAHQYLQLSPLEEMIMPLPGRSKIHVHHYFPTKSSRTKIPIYDASIPLDMGIILHFQDASAKIAAPATDLS